MNKKRLIVNERPELIQFLKNEIDGYRFTVGSNAIITVVCPRCGYEHDMMVSNLCKRHFYCPICSSGKSFPEKLFLAVLKQMKIEHIYQLNKKHYEWCGKYKYDFLLLDKKIIIETNGAQHYNSEMKYRNCRTLCETKEIDEVKKRLAEKNGYCIRYVDCSKGDLDFLKKNIINTLSEFYDTSIIDWNKCVTNTCDDGIYKICEKWNEEGSFKNTREIAEELGVSRDYVVRALHRGTEVGLCVYDGVKERLRASKKGNAVAKSKCKKVLVYDKDGNFILEYVNAKELAKNSLNILGVKLTYQGIVYTCTGEQNSHRNFKFKYKNDKD